MKKLSTITLLLCIFTLTGCHNFWHHGNGHGHGHGHGHGNGNGGHCPPGQAKKGNC